MSEQEGVAVKTGTNQAVPIVYYSQYDFGSVVVASSAKAAKADDYLVQANALLGGKGSEQEVIRLANQALAARPGAEAYFYRAYAKSDLGDKQGAIADYNQTVAIDPRYAGAYRNRGSAKFDLGDKQGAIADYSQAIAINPQDADACRNRGIAYEDTGDLGSACRDWRVAASLGVSDASDWVRKQCQ